MAIEILERQTLGFNPETKCVCGTEYCQPMLGTDTFNLYGTITPVTSENIMLDGPFGTNLLGPGANDFWDLDADWSIGTNQLIGADPAAGSQAIYLPPLGLRENHAYAITVVVNITGTEALGNGVLVTVNGNNLILPDLVNGTGNFLPDGHGANFDYSYTWLYIPNTITTDNVIVSRRNDTGTLTIQVTTLIIREVSTPGMVLYDLQGNEIFDESTFSISGNSLNVLIDGGNVNFNDTQFNNPTVIPSPGDFQSNNRYFPTIVFNDLKWMFLMELTANTFADYTGCGKFRVYDKFNNEELIYNGMFTNSLIGWDYDVGEGWSWVAGKAHFESGTPPGVVSGTLDQTVTVSEWGGIYNFSFIASNFGGVGHEMKISYDAGDGVVILQDQITQAATYNYQIDTSEFTGNTITFIFEKDAPIASFDIDTVSFMLTEHDSFVESNCVSIQENDNCTLLFAGVNTDLAFTQDVEVLGYTYDDTGVTKSIRLLAKKKYAGYPEEKEIFKFSNNLRRIMFAESDKEYQVDIGDAGEHAHDLLAVLRLMDTFTIDGVQYSPNGDYELRTRKTSDNSQAVFMVVKTQGISSNYSCS